MLNEWRYRQTLKFHSARIPTYIEHTQSTNSTHPLDPFFRALLHTAWCCVWSTAQSETHTKTHKQIKLNEIICYIYIKILKSWMGKCQREILGKRKSTKRFSILHRKSMYEYLHHMEYTHRLFLLFVCSADPQTSFEAFRSVFSPFTQLIRFIAIGIHGNIDESVKAESVGIVDGWKKAH